MNTDKTDLKKRVNNFARLMAFILIRVHPRKSAANIFWSASKAWSSAFA